MRRDTHSSSTDRVGSDLIEVERALHPTADPSVTGVDIVATTPTDVSSPVAFRLVEHLPDGVPFDAVAVHPDDDPDQWSARPEDRSLQLEGVVRPGGEFVARYGLQLHRDELDVDVLESSISVAHQIDEATASAYESDGGPLFRGPVGIPIEQAVAGNETDSPFAPETGFVTPSMATARDEAVVDDEETTVARTEETLVSALVEELRTDAVPDAQREALRAELFSTEPATESVKLRLNHLQGSVAELESSTDALESIIDGSGTTDTDLTELKAAVVDLEIETDLLDEGLASTADDVVSARKRIETLEATVYDLQQTAEAVGELTHDVEELEALHELDVKQLERRLDSIDRELVALRRWRESVTEENRPAQEQGEPNSTDDRRSA